MEMEEEAWLFSSDDEVAEDDNELQINEKYAKHYEEFRAKEIAQTLKDREAALEKLEHEVDSEDEEDETDMHGVMSSIVTFYKEELSSKEKSTSSNTNGLSTPSQDSKKKKKKKKKYTLEVYRKELFDKMSSGDVPEYDSDDQEVAPPKSNPKKINLFDDEDEIKFDKLFVTQEEKDRRIELENKLKKEGEDRTEELLKKVKAAKENSVLEGEDKSIEDAMYDIVISQLQAEARKKSQLKASAAAKNKKSEDTKVDSSEEESALKTVTETAKLFERDEATRPISYPKIETNTVRDKNSKRKEAREKKKERKEAEMMRLRQEVNELKAVKKKEIQAKLEKIKEVTGQDRLAFGEEDLEENFDPDEHDRKMALMYNEDYYGEMDDKKPTFDYDEEIDGDFENYDEFQANESDDYPDEEADPVGGSAEAGKDNGQECEGEETTLFSGAPLSRRRRRGRSKKFTEALLKSKPRFDPEKHIDFEKYYDEYYGLDFEDVIGDVKCRFKYKTVNPNDLGLSTEEVLMADDKELNKFYSLKKLLRNNRTNEMESKERKRCADKVRDEEYMTKHFPSLYVQEEEEANAANSTIIDENEEQRKEDEKKKTKNLKKKLRRDKKLAGESSNNETVTEKENGQVEINGLQSLENEKNDVGSVPEMKEKDKMNKKRKRKSDSNRKDSKSKRRKVDGRVSKKAKLDPSDPFSAVLQISNDRLSAYGLPAPVQLKKKISHLKKQEKKGTIKDALETFRFPTKSTEKRKKQLKGKKKKSTSVD